MACRLKKFGINYEIYDLDSTPPQIVPPQWKVLDCTGCSRFMLSFPVFICFRMLRCVSNCHTRPPRPPSTSRCVLLTTPEFYLACSEYICFFFRLDSRNFLAFWGLVRWVFQPRRLCGFSGWAFALRPSGSLTLQFSFHFLDTENFTL